MRFTNLIDSQCLSLSQDKAYQSLVCREPRDSVVKKKTLEVFLRVDEHVGLP